MRTVTLECNVSTGDRRAMDKQHGVDNRVEQDDIRPQTVTIDRDVYTWLLWQVADSLAKGVHTNQSEIVETSIQELMANPQDAPAPVKRNKGDYVSRTFRLSPETWSWLHEEHIRRLSAGRHDGAISQIVVSALRRRMATNS